jgi:hypothetical protein
MGVKQVNTQQERVKGPQHSGVMKERSRALEGKLSGSIKQARLRLVFVHGAEPDAPSSLMPVGAATTTTQIRSDGIAVACS